MPKRADISDMLIHFTKGNSGTDAFGTLRRIMSERRLLAGNYMIRGGYRCVCFTEAPLAAVADGFFAGPSFRYAPFGLMFHKSLIFSAGGRPVIYQPESEFMALPEEMRWRHVRYEPTREDPVDFTWEREWRIRCEEFCFSPADALVVLPNGEWLDYLLDIHCHEQDMMVQAYSTVFDEDEMYIAEQLRENFTWRVATLG
jgi:hypothetical protein